MLLWGRAFVQKIYANLYGAAFVQISSIWDILISRADFVMIFLKYINPLKLARIYFYNDPCVFSLQPI
jgi:hypothetical protein